MRSDYGLYIVAVICFIIAGIFLTGAIPGYTFADSMGLVSIAVFLILGIIFGVTGYATKPKTTTPITPTPVMQPMSPMTETDSSPMDSPPPQVEEIKPEPQPEPEPVVEPPMQEETVAPTPSEGIPMPAEEVLTPVPPPPPPLASVEETVKTEEAKPPEEKQVRRRRRKKAE